MPVLPVDQVIGYAYAAGFRGIDLIYSVCISKVESDWNSDAHNTTPPDDSWGLWQINMIGRLGEARRKEFNLLSDSDLSRPDINANAAHRVFEDAGRSFTPWTSFTSGKWQDHLTEVSRAVNWWHNIFTLTRVLEIGETGPDVARLQTIVGAPSDGVFGLITRARVQRWQAGHGLKVDGIVGPQTCASLEWRWAG